MALKSSLIYGNGIPRPSGFLEPITMSTSAATPALVLDLTGKFLLSYLGQDTNFGGGLEFTKIEVDGEILFDYAGGVGQMAPVGYLARDGGSLNADAYTMMGEPLRINERLKVWGKGPSTSNTWRGIALVTPIK